MTFAVTARNRFSWRCVALLFVALWAESGRAQLVDEEPQDVEAVVATDAEPEATAEPEPIPQPQGAEPLAEVDGSPSDETATDDPPATEDAANAGSMPLEADSSVDEGSLGEANPEAAQASEAPASAEPRVPVDAARFRGIQPGNATSQDLLDAWGAPQQIRKIEGGVEHYYRIEPFERVRVTLIEDQVASIMILLGKPFEPGMLAKQLQIDDVEAVAVPDAKGQLLGQAYPERGVLFGFAPNTPTTHVSQIVLEPIDGQSFVLRAETNLHTRYVNSLADADYALKLNPENARAHWVRGEALCLAGDYSRGLQAAEAAVALEPETHEYRLSLAKILAETADYTNAIDHVRQVTDSKSASAVHKARAYCLWGDCVAASADRNFAQAIEYHQKAIKLAEPLVADEQVVVRRAAKELLLDAHLAVAYDIAWGRWQQKPKVVPKWLERADAYANTIVQDENGSEEVRLRVALRALAALAGIPDPPDAKVWTERAMQLGSSLIEQSNDSARQARLRWLVGIALGDALQIEQVRGNADQAAKHGELAVRLLDEGQAAGEQVPGRDYIIGRLYYRVGVIDAVVRGDHKQALAWYDKAVPLLESPVPPSALTDAGRQGEAFVSIAVSYWEAGNQEEAMRLTTQGVRLMEQAVREGLLEKPALAVPYSNLASMHENLGDKQGAKEFAELAAHCEAEKKNQ